MPSSVELLRWLSCVAWLKVNCVTDSTWQSSPSHGDPICVYAKSGKLKIIANKNFLLENMSGLLGVGERNWFPIAESHLNWILSLQAVKTLVVIVNKIDLSVFHLKKVIWLHPSSGFVVTSSNRFYLQKICVKDFYERNLLWRSSTFVSIQFDI